MPSCSSSGRNMFIRKKKHKEKIREECNVSASQIMTKQLAQVVQAKQRKNNNQASRNFAQLQRENRHQRKSPIMGMT